MSTWPEVINRANTDPAFREQLKADPTATCEQAGCEVPTGATVEVIEETGDEMHLFLGARTNNSAVNGVLEKAEKDTAFRKTLLADPNEVLEAATGEKLPTAVKIRVHEPIAKRIRLILSPLSDGANELSDQELNAVAGGTKSLWTRIRDVVCRDVPIAVTIQGDGQGDRTGVGVVKTRSTNTQMGADAASI